jgi:prepilin-type N-terminal cleavage/methylation domain-containing protein
MKKGFTVLELLIVIAIIGILASVIIPSVNGGREKALKSRTLSELKTMATALELYRNDNNGNYPADVSRDLPPGLGAYLGGNQSAAWPDAPWPGSVYDWDNWDDPDYPGEKIYQISIRFCPAGGPLSACVFPPEPWAANFGVNSSYYYCIGGRCRAHLSEAYTYPGYCANCTVQPSP